MITFIYKRNAFCILFIAFCANEPGNHHRQQVLQGIPQYIFAFSKTAFPWIGLMKFFHFWGTRCENVV